MDARTDRQMNRQTDEWTDRQTVTPSSRRRLHSQWESGDHPSRQGADAITDGGSWGSSFQHTAQQLQQHQAYEEGRGLTPRRPSFSALSSNSAGTPSSGAPPSCPYEQTSHAKTYFPGCVRGARAGRNQAFSTRLLLFSHKMDEY